MCKKIFSLPRSWQDLRAPCLHRARAQSSGKPIIRRVASKCKNVFQKERNISVGKTKKKKRNSFFSSPPPGHCNPSRNPLASAEKKTRKKVVQLVWPWRPLLLLPFSLSWEREENKCSSIKLERTPWSVLINSGPVVAETRTKEMWKMFFLYHRFDEKHP